MEQSIFTEKNLTKALLFLALPSMFGQLTTLVYNLAETYFVSLTNDPDQIAAVTLGAPVLLIIMSIASIFGTGGSSVIARLIGQKADAKAKEVANYCLFTMLGTSLAVAVAGSIFLPQIVQLLGADSQNSGFTAEYLKFIFYGAPLIMFSNGMLHIFRAVGLISQGTIGLLIGNIANVVFCFIFVVTLNLGVKGAALAAITGFLLNSLYYVICILMLGKQKHPIFHISIKNYKSSFDTAKQVFSIGIPGALVTVLMSIVSIVLNNFIGIYGSYAVASYGIAYKITLIAVMLSVGLAQGVVPLIGYCYGAKEKLRLKKTMNLSLCYCVGIGLVFAAIYLIFNNFLVSLFFTDTELINLSSYFMKILSLSLPLMGITNMVTGYFQALGKSLHSLFITILKNIILFIPAIILFNTLFGLTGVIAAQPIVECIISLVCMLLLQLDLKRYMEYDDSHSSIELNSIY